MSRAWRAALKVGDDLTVVTRFTASGVNRHKGHVIYEDDNYVAVCWHNDHGVKQTCHFWRGSGRRVADPATRVYKISLEPYVEPTR